jgi:RimJ/RimL family protein N-acetyltransferase
MASLDTAHAPVRTERLLLRPLRTSDAEPLCALFADWEVIRRLSMPPWPYTLEDAYSFIREHRDKDLRTAFAITLADALIGGIDVRMNPANQSQRGPGPNRDGETMAYSRPRDGEFPHVNTVLTRARFEGHRP